jgi:hypothetical protein
VTNTTFPDQLDTFVNPQGTDSVQLVSHALQHSKVNDALYAIELKLGVTNSADPTSIENRLLTLKAFVDNITTANVAESITNLYFTDKRAKDAIAQALESGTHSHITFNYDNQTGAISLSTASDVVLNTGLQNTLGDYLTTSAFNAQLDEPGGTPTLDVDGLIRDTQIPSLIARDSEVQTAVSASQALAISTAASDATTKANAAQAAAIAAAATDATTKANTAKSEAISTAAADATAKADAARQAAISAVTNSAPAVLDTLKELSDALGSDPNFATTMATNLAGKSNVGHTHTSSNVTDFVEAAQDAAALLFNHSTHNNLTATYDDENNKVILTVTPQLTQEQVQDYIAPLFTHGNNKNMNILYDDEANQLTFEAITEPSKAVMSNTAPTNPANGAFWLDTDELRSGDVLALKIWNQAGNKWEYAASALSLATTNVWTSKNTFNQGVVIGMDIAPANPVEGQIYYNLAAEKLRVFDGLVWKDVSGSSGGGGGLPSISTDGTATPATLFFGMIAPPSAAALEGDIWFDVDDLGAPYGQFFTGLTAPDPDQYEFWVDPSLQPGELIYSATEPQTPTYTGELWIDTDDLDGQLVQIGTTAPDPNNAQLWVDTQDLDTPTYYSNLYFPTYNSVSEFPYAVSKPGMIAVDSSTNIVYVSINGGWVPQPLNAKVSEVEVISRSNEALIWMGFL